MERSPLSRQIRRLESGLGVRLFHRQPRIVSLTAAGEHFRTDVRRILADLEPSIATARELASSRAPFGLGVAEAAAAPALGRLLKTASRFQLAFDPETGKVTGDFVHWAHPLWTYEGVVEADGRLHLKSQGSSFDVEGGRIDYDDVFEVGSLDERRLLSRMVGQDGQWRDFMVTTYRRKA